MNLLPRTKVIHDKNAVAAGTSTQNGSTIDMSGFRGCLIIADIGACTDTAVPWLKCLQGDASDGSDGVVIPGTSASVAALSGNLDNKTMILDIYRSQHRYLTPQLLRTTANVVLNAIVCILYDPINEPTSADSTNNTAQTVCDPAA